MLISTQKKIIYNWSCSSNLRLRVSHLMGALFNPLSLWMSSTSYKVNTINYLKLSTQRTICFCKSGIFSLARDRNYLSYLQGVGGLRGGGVSSLICPELLQTNSLHKPPSPRCYLCVHVYEIIESDWLQYMRLRYSAENYWALKSTGNHKTSKLGKHMSVTVWKWVPVQE